MKKILFPMAALALSFGIYSCSDDDNTPDMPGPEVQYSTGVYIVNSGSQYMNIAGSLDFFNYETNTLATDIFSKANGGQTIGDVFNDGIAYNGKLYLAVTNSEVLHIVNGSDYKLEKSITFRDYGSAGINPGGPRHLTTYNGMVYLTLFGDPGYLAEINPATGEVTNMVEVGPQPEYVVAFNNQLYVAVSDGYSDYSRSCVAVVDPETFTVTKKITAEGFVNPVNLVTNGSRLFVCSWGQYLSTPPYSQYNYGLYEIVNNTLGEKLVDATSVSMSGDKIYYLDDPYGTDETKYGVFDINTAQDGTFIAAADGVVSPIAIIADPYGDNVFVLSYYLSEGFPSYTTDGYMNMYKSDGTFVQKIATGVSTATLFFNYAM